MRVVAQEKTRPNGSERVHLCIMRVLEGAHNCISPTQGDDGEAAMGGSVRVR